MREKLLKILKKRLDDLKAKERDFFINSHWHGKNGEYAHDLAILQKKIRLLQKKIQKCEGSK